jgi:hypothetical protein
MESDVNDAIVSKSRTLQGKGAGLKYRGIAMLTAIEPGEFLG